MPNYSWGEKPKRRAKFLLEKLLDLEKSENPNFKCSWDCQAKYKQSGQEVTYYEFSIETTSKNLLHFINDCSEEKWNKGYLRQAIDQIEETIIGGKSKDRKGQPTLKIKLYLWHDKYNKKQNVDRFCKEWDKNSPTTGSGVEQATSETNDKQSMHRELIELLDTELARNNDLLIKIIKSSRNHFCAEIENRPRNTSWREVDRLNNNSLIKLTELLRKYYYPQLENRLRNNNWEEADRLTSEIIWELAGTSQKRSFRAEVSRDFSCEDLRTIDAFWTKYSDGHFGFSVQRSIWQSSDVNENLIKFMSHVGWGNLEKQEDGQDIFYFVPVNDFSLNAPKGQLPWFVAWSGSDGFRDRKAYLSRIVRCKI